MYDGSGANVQQNFDDFVSPPSSVILNVTAPNISILAQGIPSNLATNFEFHYYGTSLVANNIECTLVSNQPNPSILFTGGNPADFQFYDYIHEVWTNASLEDPGSYGFNCDFNKTNTWKYIDPGIIPAAPSSTTYFWLVYDSNAQNHSQLYDNVEFGTCDSIEDITNVPMTSSTIEAIIFAAQNSDYTVKILLFLCGILLIDLVRRVLTPKSWSR